MPKHRSREIPEAFGLDPALRSVLNNNREASEEEIEDVRASMREMRDDMSELRGVMMRVERSSAKAEEASLKAYGYCQAFADKYLAQAGYIIAADATIPPMREKAPTLKELDTRVRDAEKSDKHLVEEIEMMRQQLENAEAAKATAERAALQHELERANKVIADAAEAERADRMKSRERRIALGWEVLKWAVLIFLTSVVSHIAWKH
jgi:chromosome segregation ATPase